MKEKKKKKRIFKKYLTLILLLISTFFLGLIAFINVLPLVFYLIILFIVFLSDFILIRMMFKKKHPVKWAVPIVLVIIILYIVGCFYGFSTARFLNRLGICDIKTYNYALVVLNSSDIKKAKTLKNKDVLLISENDDTLSLVKDEIKAKIKLSDDFLDGLEQLTSNAIDALILEKSYLEILKDEDYNTYKEINIIDEFSVDLVTKIDKTKKDISKESFNILLSGIDTTGKISSVARSDVNMLVSVNPSTNQVVLTSIPRDYYVTIIEGKMKDKLTHSGIYGIDKTMYAVGNLLDVKIDYYVKVNFSSVVQIIDVIGNVSVYSDANFTSGVYEYNEYRYKFVKGYNEVNGKKALAFARERKAFSDGDIRRGIHQQALIEAMAKKLLEPQTLIKYNSILKELEDSFVTNMDHDNISKLIKKQIDNNKSWEFINRSLKGNSSYEYTYTYKKSKSDCMIPNEDTVKEAKKTIKEILDK